MDNQKYEVIKPWYGVSKGDVVDSVGEMFLPNVRPLTANIENNNSDDVNAELELKIEALEAENQKLTDENAKLKEANKKLKAELKKAGQEVAEEV